MDNVLDTPRGTTSRRSEKRYLAAPRSEPRLISASIRAFERPTLIIGPLARFPCEHDARVTRRTVYKSGVEIRDLPREEILSRAGERARDDRRRR